MTKKIMTLIFMGISVCLSGTNVMAKKGGLCVEECEDNLRTCISTNGIDCWKKRKGCIQGCK